MNCIVVNLEKPERQPLIESIVREITSRFPNSIKLYDDKLVFIEEVYGGSNFYYYNQDKNKLDSLSDCNVEGMTVEDLTDEIKSIILDYHLVVKPICSDNSSSLVCREFMCFGDSISVLFMKTWYFSYSSYEEVKDDLENSQREFTAFKKRVGKYVTNNNIDELRQLNTKSYQLGLYF